jgi:hypothetical protein
MNPTPPAAEASRCATTAMMARKSGYGKPFRELVCGHIFWHR